MEKNCKIKIPNISNCKRLLILHKRRFKCKHCEKTFICETNLVGKNKNISNNTELQIKLELMKKQSEKDIAEGVSVSKIDRILNKISSHTVLRHENIPTNMNWDEFKSTKNTKGKIAFIITDNDSGNIFDINDSRRSIDLEKYFKRYSKKQRDKVKLISTDFYPSYIHLAKRLFKNTSIVINRFHIVTQVYVALNITRIKLCYKDNPNYNKLKYYWKLIVKNKNDLSDKKFYSKHFHKYISQKDIVTYLINTNRILKATYECYQGIINSIKNKDFKTFINIILIMEKLKVLII